jgi:hypothetical protein
MVVILPSAQLASDHSMDVVIGCLWPSDAFTRFIDDSLTVVNQSMN